MIGSCESRKPSSGWCATVGALSLRDIVGIEIHFLNSFLMGFYFDFLSKLGPKALQTFGGKSSSESRREKDR